MGLPAVCDRERDGNDDSRIDTVEETIMRTVLVAVASALVAGCATAPAPDRSTIIDHKYNTVRYAAKPADSDFVGTSANASSNTNPSWHRFGHP